MKNKITLLTIVLALYGLSIYAQTNLNFENWTGNEPNGWTTSNSFTQPNGGAQTVFKVTTNPGQGSASVKMVTGSCPDCPGFSILGIPTPLPNPLGGSIQLGTFENTGISYTQRPISMDFKYKSNPMGNDAGGFQVELTRYNSTTEEDETIGEGYFEVNSAVTTWTSMNIPIVYYSSLQPDKMNIFAASSIGSIPDFSAFGLPSPSQLGLPTPVAGSEFYLDAIVFNMPSCAGFTISVTGTNETSLGANDGTATATPNGGATPYSYSWSNLAATQSINGLIPGYYNVIVTDANQCQKVGSYYVAPGGCNLSVSVTGTNSSTNSIYTGNGTAVANVSGGNPPYNYTWNTGATTSSISNLAVGTYAVLVVEQNNPDCAVWGYYTVWSGTSGVKDLSMDNTIDIYPNPSNGIFVVKSENRISKIEIVNLLGERIYSSKLKSQTSNEIDLSKYPKGIYFVKIYDGEKSYTEKIVIQ